MGPAQQRHRRRYLRQTVCRKTSNQNHDSETFIADSGTPSLMVNPEENMTNLKDAKTRVTVGDSRTLTGTKTWQLEQLSET